MINYEEKLKKNSYDVKSFFADMETYVRLANQKKIIYSVESVSRSGLRRTIAIRGLEKYGLRNFDTMLKVLDYRFDKNGDVIVKGWGMNMLWHTHNTILDKISNCGIKFNRKNPNFDNPQVI